MQTKQVNPPIFLRLVATVLLIAIMSVSAWSQTGQDDSAGIVLVADGTPIHLILLDDLQGKKLQVKQLVRFKVREDLVVDSKVIVKTGIEAFGHVDSVSKNGLLGKAGRLVVQFDFVNAVSGAKIPLCGGAGVGGGKGGALTWESALWYGPDANMPVGTKINAFVYRDQRLAVP
jgi:hypothetical protein